MLIRRVVVADDEKIQRDVLAVVLQKLLPGTEVISCADGQEAYGEIEKEETQLLVTDICMPILDGIGLIEKVSATYPEVKIVLVSAYQEFEYARSAIRFGVSEYLLKPFRVEDARKLVERVSGILEEEQEQSRQQSCYAAMLEKEKADERQSLLRKLIEGTLDEETLPEIFSELEGPGVAAIIRWKNLGEKGQRYQKRRMKERQEMLLDALEDGKWLGYSGREKHLVELNRGLNRQENRYALLLPEAEEEEIARALAGLVEEMKEKGLICHAGISERKEMLLGEISKAVQQADDALSFCFYQPWENCVFSYRKLYTAPEPQLPPLTDYERRLREAVRSGASKGLGETLRQLKGELERGSLCYPGRVRHRISSIVVSILREVEGMISQKEYDILLNVAYSRYVECDSLEQLFIISEELLEEVAGYFVKAPEAYDAVEICVAFLRQHLEEDISLQTLAEMVHFHPNYLSAQIKKKLGVSFSTYLLNLRMETACRLLTETDCRVLDIARRCGFRDSSYFNRIFRREYQMSPEQFRKVHTSCRQE